MPAYRPLRRSQLISPFGIGSMVDFPKDESLMPAGLEAWPFATEKCPPESGWLLREERLEARLRVTHFRIPPDHREPDRGAQFTNQDIPFVRFPRWHYCHHCGGMELLSIYSSQRERCRGREYQYQSCHPKPERKRPFLIPVRFVSVCEAGHIQDFPFLEWVHRDVPIGQDCKLRLRAGRSSAGLSGITIDCSCGKSQSLGDVFRFDEKAGGVLSKLGLMCRGLRPWLGEIDASTISCGKHLRVLQRGASNAYFPHVISSIYLPLWAEDSGADIAALLDQPRVWEQLSQRTVGGRIDQTVCSVIAELACVDASQLEKAAQRKLAGVGLVSGAAVTLDEEGFRRAEYNAICDGKVGPQSELYVEIANLANYEPLMARYFSRIRLVHKLRETRVLAGFTRIIPPDGNLTSNRLQRLQLDDRIDWLPGIKTYGEGIFLEINPIEIERWLTQEPLIKSRIEPLISRYNATRTTRQQPHRNATAKFLLLHTLAHVLINQLSFDCGYGSASLRERLYCDFSNTDEPMQGILIYTASGDSEGTMGGLVRQGKQGRLEKTLLRAILRAAWCSSDPVCIECNGQGSDNANLSACHSCSLLPETSCEEGNRLLDRAMLVGLPELTSLGFFSGYLGANG